VASWRLSITGKLPPVRDVLSLTLYSEHHVFHPDELDRYSFGTKITNLHRAGHGSLTLTASATRPRTGSRGPTGNGGRDGADERSD